MTHEAGAATLAWDRGSFRDRGNRVYDDGATIYRGVDETALENFRRFSETPLFKKFVDNGKIVRTEILPAGARPDLPEGWAGFLAHERLPFISYPYEWSFGELKDAALLQLELLEKFIPAGWTHKDASAFNIQFHGARPVFIDVPSFEPYVEGEPWVGYRQFCMMYLYPLMLRAYKDIDYRPFLRASLEGVEPDTANRILSGFTRLKKGVLGHVYLHAKMQSRSSGAEINEARSLTEDSGKSVTEKKGVKHSMAMVLGTIQGLRRTVEKLTIADGQTTWGDYDTGHSYARESFETKKAFIAKHAGARQRRLTWDLGCNTGTFSKICAEHADYVVSVDGDQKAIERFYQEQKAAGGKNILSLVMDLANISPNQGWRRRERKAFDKRAQPELILCLALIHHIVISANIPLEEFVGWLRDRNADVVLEYVGLEDDMVKIMLRNRVNQYEDLSAGTFEQIVSERFTIADTQPLKGGHRKLYFLTPR